MLSFVIYVIFIIMFLRITIVVFVFCFNHRFNLSINVINDLFKGYQLNNLYMIYFHINL
jgi:hypothetical protein